MMRHTFFIIKHVLKFKMGNVREFVNMSNGFYNGFENNCNLSCLGFVEKSYRLKIFLIWLNTLNSYLESEKKRESFLLD